MRPVCAVLAGAVLLAAATAGIAAGRPAGVARLRLGVPHAATWYVRYQDGELRMAPSLKGLKTAKPLGQRLPEWVESGEGQVTRRRYYAETALSGPVGKFSTVRVRPTVETMSWDPPEDPAPLPDELQLEAHFLLRDGSGVVWDYVTSNTCWLTEANQPGKSEVEEIAVPDPARLTIALEASGGERFYGFHREVMLGPQALLDLRRDGKPVTVQVTVASADGKSVYDKTDEIGKFMALVTNVSPEQVPPGTYTVTASIGRTPFSEPVSVSKRVEVK